MLELLVTCCDSAAVCLSDGQVVCMSTARGVVLGGTI